MKQVTSNTTDDHALMRQVGEGDAAAYRELVRRHAPTCLRFAERMLGNRSDAEDVMQETCLKLWREAAHWQPNARLTTWLYRVVWNACIDHRRRARPERHDEDMARFVDDRPPIDDQLASLEASERVRHAMQTLPERQRAAITLCYYEGIGGDEAAAILQISPGALHASLHRARQQLKERLKENPDATTGTDRGRIHVHAT